MAFAFLDSLVGLSGKLRARFVARGTPTLAIPDPRPTLRRQRTRVTGVHPLMDATRSFSLITMLPFSAKQAGRIWLVSDWKLAVRASPAALVRVRESERVH